MKDRWLSIAFLIGIICLTVIVAWGGLACAYNPLPFEIMAGGEPTIGKGQTPILLAIRGDDPDRAVPDGLPDIAKEALRRVFAKPDPSLYIIIYDGWKATSGYQVRINSIAIRREIWNERLVVNYSVDKPDVSKKSVAEVFTYPFVIARVSNTSMRAADVIFERQ